MDWSAVWADFFCLIQTLFTLDGLPYKKRILVLDQEYTILNALSKQNSLNN